MLFDISAYRPAIESRTVSQICHLICSLVGTDVRQIKPLPTIFRHEQTFHCLKVMVFSEVIVGKNTDFGTRGTFMMRDATVEQENILKRTNFNH